jgi:hypothetical protein
MGSPVPPNVPILMVALQSLSRASWAGQLPPVTAGAAFWAEARIVASLVANGQAELAPPSTVAPPAEPAWTAHGQPGFAAGTSNSSHAWVPSAAGTADGGGAAAPGPQEQGGVIDGGSPAGGGSGRVLDGGTP